MCDSNANCVVVIKFCLKPYLTAALGPYNVIATHNKVFIKFGTL